MRDESNALGSMGNAYAALGDPRRAVELYEQRLQMAREIDDRRGEAVASWNLGEQYEALGELDKAIAAMQVCVDFERAMGHPDAEKDAVRVAELHARRRG
jgi:tetratricopeptide (TPR) repeat protein